MVKSIKLYGLMLAALVASTLIGCASVTPNRTPLVMDAKETALPGVSKPWASIGVGTAPVDYIGLSGRDDFIVQESMDSDPLPEFPVKGFSYTNAAAYDVIRTLISYGDRDITLAYDLSQGSTGKRSISAYNVKGTFASVLASLSHTVGFFYRYKNGVLYISSDKQYITALPPVAELLESIPSVVRNLGGMDVLVDRSARLVSFRANRTAYEKIQGYLNYIRANRSLITYDCYIWEVVLNDHSQMGINWRAFPQRLASESAVSGVAATYDGDAHSAALNLTSAASLANGVGIGMAVKSSHFALSTMLDFLQSQGTVNNVSQPKISLLSGTTAQFRNGNSIQYISKIAPGAISNGTFLPGSADTATLQTGITMTIAGDISDDTVFSDVSLKMADLVRMDKAQVAVGQNGTSTTISLPVSADREISTRVRVRPGDAIIIGGINLQQVSNAFTGVGPLPTSSDKEVQRSELVVVLIPRVAHFTAETEKKEPKQ